MALKIEIPLEEGWTCKSPVDLPVRERLEASRGVKSPKSPEDLLKAEKYAEKLREAYLEAVQQRAARESQRLKEAQACTQTSTL